MSFQGCLVVERAIDWRIIVGTKAEYVSRDVPTDELVTCVQLMTQACRTEASQLRVGAGVNVLFLRRP